ncbi:putative C6 transcription factor [Talaromyces proteolyticus]|uniref:C6 transcription factor n=1 Tax=Talaromyces proteolyticus TaxID=1131652 RepID=A0AAD4KFD7_9EURO|nr:putative C6 transcription factor [Talaromyces proteolyticus]KAH8688994.1 putative C6 transcription factor [Talaromyces proteolyticus]
MTKVSERDTIDDHFRESTLGAVQSSSSIDLTSPPSRSWTRALQHQNGDLPGSLGNAPLRDRYIADWTKRATSFTTVGVLGPTSYSAVYSESDDVARSSNVAGSLRDVSHSLQHNFSAIDDGQIQLGAELLLILYDDFTLYERMATMGYDQCEGYLWALPVLRLIFTSVRQMLDDAIEDESDPLPSLRRLSKCIFENCSQPVNIYLNMTPPEFFGAMPRKWEVIGLMFSIIGSSACLLPQSDFKMHGAPSLDRNGLAVVCVSAGEICLRFCDNAGVISEQLSWVLLSHTSLLTFLYGDHDYRPWKSLGDLSTVIFALGFHQQEAFTKLPMFIIEYRRRLMIAAYGLDKELATFLGRPPRISWRHIDIELPIDLEYDVLIAEPEVRDAAMANIGEGGWNTTGVVSNISYARVMYTMGQIREYVLEVSLNPKIFEDLEGRILEISNLSRKVRDDLPAVFKWNLQSFENMEHGRTQAYILLCIHLSFLHSDFILQRVLVKRKGAGSETLMNIAHEMLSTLLIAVANRSRDGRDNNTIAWTMSLFGLPSAGALAIELLRQTQTPQSSASFPRSEVIQNLSRFAADLEYAILEHAGNYEICQQARKVIRHVLDRVLSAPPAMPFASSSLVTEPDFAPMDWLTSDDTWLNQDSDFMKWVDSFDWGQELGDR